MGFLCRWALKGCSGRPVRQGEASRQRRGAVEAEPPQHPNTPGQCALAQPPPLALPRPHARCLTQPSLQRLELLPFNLSGSIFKYGIPGTVAMKKGDAGDGGTVSRDVAIAIRVLPPGLAKDGLFQLRHHLCFSPPVAAGEGRQERGWSQANRRLLRPLDSSLLCSPRLNSSNLSRLLVPTTRLQWRQ